jgi:ribosomal protein S18 acetylase RimI-like enzyme
MFLEVLNKEKTQIAHCCFTQENEIYNLFVVESCRRKHIATNIMLILKEKVFPYYNKIWLKVGGENSENNFRFSFYEKFGFVRRKNEKKVNYHICPRMDYIGEKNERDRIAS